MLFVLAAGFCGLSGWYAALCAWRAGGRWAAVVVRLLSAGRHFKLKNLGGRVSFISSVKHTS